VFLPPSDPQHGRLVLGLCGAPGAGKTSLAEHLVRALLASGRSAAHVPMDGFHLADAELARQDLSARKGAPETFDAWGYAALLARLGERPPTSRARFDRPSGSRSPPLIIGPGAGRVTEGGFCSTGQVAGRAGSSASVVRDRRGASTRPGSSHGNGPSKETDGRRLGGVSGPGQRAPPRGLPPAGAAGRPTRWRPA
jgi:hypothetical protein